MPSIPQLLLLLSLGACASPGGHHADAARARPTLTGALPSASAEPDDGLAPEGKVLPAGVGFTTGPTATLVGATLDFPLDKNLTFGPSLQYGFDDDVDILALTGQLKYFLGTDSAQGQPSLLPYVTGGIGFAKLDKDNRSADSGVLLNVGAGVRYLTGEQYRLGSEARLNYLPDDLGGENSYFSFEVLQLVLSF
jgi:hypothetical protein